MLRESVDFSTNDFVLSRGSCALLWAILLGTLAFMVFFPVSNWNGIWFCLIFGIGYPLVALAQGCLNFRKHLTGYDVELLDGKFTFSERFNHDEESFVGSAQSSVLLEDCRWRQGFVENSVSCNNYSWRFPLFPWRSVPVLELVFRSSDLADGQSRRLYHQQCVYPLGFSEATRETWRQVLEDKGVLRLPNRWRWEALCHGLALYLGVVLVGVCCPVGMKFFFSLIENANFSFYPMSWFFLVLLIPFLLLHFSYWLTGNTDSDLDETLKSYIFWWMILPPIIDVCVFGVLFF
ncbi:MAG: hypothetical protein Q4D38_06290 [Planctomycetia bacterium]|nr:hypothetical protein [Planctomycetia bacterium]